MFRNKQLNRYISYFEKLNTENIDTYKGGDEDLDVLFCIANKNHFSCIEEFYAAVVKLQYSYIGNSEVFDDFKNTLKESEIRSTSFPEAAKFLGEWNLGFNVMDEWISTATDVVHTYVVNQEDGCSEYLFENNKEYIFSGIST